MKSSRLTTLAGLALTPALLTAAPQLEEVLVTAELRHTPLLQQTGSTSVISEQAIRQRAAQQLEEILNIAPNVNFASGASRARYFQIRGIGERSQFQEPLNPAVGVVIDGIDFSGLGTAAMLYDIEQVEVLRGPQGTLHGANALAGLINVRSAAPSSNAAYRADASLTSYNGRQIGLMATGPLTSNQLLYRIALNQHHSNGFMENDFLGVKDTNNRDETLLRARLRWLANDDNTLDISLFHSDMDNGYDAFSLDNTRHTLSDKPGADRQRSTALGFNWRLDRAAVEWELATSVASTRSDYGFDEDWTFVGIAPGWEYSSTDQMLRDRDSFGAQLRALSGEAGRLFEGSTNWVAGLYYLGNREDLERRYTFFDANFFSRYDTDSMALFGQLDTELSDHISLLSGLRLERRNNKYSDSNGIADDPQKNLWGGRLALQYQLASGIIYGEVSRGYRAHGVNANILANLNASQDPALRGQLSKLRSFDDEQLTNYEMGFKSSLFAGALQTRLAVFYMDRVDQQVKGSLAIPRANGSTQFIDHTSNAAQGNNYGMEAELDWVANDRLKVYLNIGLLETEFEQYINADGENLAGRAQAHAPSFQYAVGGEFVLGGGFHLRLDLEGKDEFFFSDRHAVKSPAHNLAHMRLDYRNDHWSVSLWAQNLTDEDYFVRGFGSFGNDPRKQYLVEPYLQFGAPRVIGLSASYSLER